MRAKSKVSNEIIRSNLTPTLRASTNAFEQAALAAIAAGYASKPTRRAFVSDLRNWLAFCEANAVNPWTALPLSAGIFREWQLRDHAPKSVLRNMQNLDSLYKRLMLGNAQLKNPFDPKVTGRPPDKVVNPHPAVSEEAAGRIFAAIARDFDLFKAGPVQGVRHAYRDRALLALLWSTGCRRQFVAELQRKDWKLLESGEAEARSAWKGGTMRVIRVPAEAAAAVEAWLKLGQTPSVFNLKTDGVYNVVKVRAAQAGVDPKKIRPHGFRAGFATRAYDAQVPEVAIQAAMGHANVNDTRQYDRGNRGADAVRQVGKLPGGTL